MNDTTLPIKQGGKKKIVNPRQQRDGKNLRPGFGLHDWMTLLRHAKDLAQRKGAPIRKDITLAEVQQHNKPYDGWMILRGKVYNISPYIAYHPGGASILEKCVGKDATALFDKYHSWVNIDNLVGVLLLGYLVVEKRSRDDDDSGIGYLNNNAVGASSANNQQNLVMPTSTTKATVTAMSSIEDIGFAMPKPRPPKGEPISSLLPRDDDNENEKDEDDALML